MKKEVRGINILVIIDAMVKVRKALEAQSIPVQVEQVNTTPITPEFDIEAELALREKRALRFNSPFDKEATRKILLEEHRKKEAAQQSKSIESVYQPVSIFNEE